VKPRKACVRRIDDRAAALAGTGGRAVWQIIPVNGELGADEKPAKGNDALDAAPSRNAGQSSRYMCLLGAGGQLSPASAPAHGAGTRRPGNASLSSGRT
jgi:hypothetical protein